MRINTILACLTSVDAAKPVLHAATLLARKNNAHLIGLHTRESALAYARFGMHMPSSMILEFDRSQDEEVKAIESLFDTATKAEDFVSEWRVERTETVSASERMLESGRAADIVILPQPDTKTDRGSDASLAEQVIRNSGRPVLVVPRDFKGDRIGQVVLIGWSGTREAARAGHDAISVADEGAEAILLTVSRGEHVDPMADLTAKDMAAALARHGLHPTTCHRSAGGAEIAEIMMREAMERGADLIVTGAYGHSALYDFVIGAVTRDLLTKTEIPILFSK